MSRLHFDPLAPHRLPVSLLGFTPPRGTGINGGLAAAPKSCRHAFMSSTAVHPRHALPLPESGNDPMYPTAWVPGLVLLVCVAMRQQRMVNLLDLPQGKANHEAEAGVSCRKTMANTSCVACQDTFFLLSSCRQ